MSIYLLLYFIGIIGLLFVGIKFFKAYIKYDFGKYFLLSILAYCVWLIIYISSFTVAYNVEILLWLSKIMYGLALFAMYSMLLFFVSFPKKESNIYYRFFFLLILSLGVLSVLSPFIIRGMLFNSVSGVYYEDYGFLYPIYAILYLINPILIFIFYLYNFKKLTLINRERLKYIAFGYLSLSVLHIIFLAILPLLGIWIFQKEQVIFFIPFILGIGYSMNRYYFSNIKISFGKILVFLLSIFWSIIGVNILKYYYLNIIHKILIDFWGTTQEFGIADLILGIIIFLISHNFLTKAFLGDTQNTNFRRELSTLKSKASFINSLPDLNDFLKRKFQECFKIKYAEITIFKKHTDQREIYKYFSKNPLHDLFINDIVFIEENKNKFDYKKIKNEIHPNTYLIIPLFNKKNEIIGIFSIASKPFKDSYSIEEIYLLKRFAHFLEGHLQYLKTYSKLQDLSINLDKKIDEQTIEYNNLISQQKDFISLISHEIKGPVASALFQADSILDDVEDDAYDKNHLRRELGILNKKLKDAGELMNKLFDVQKYEKQGVKLYKEQIDFDNYIEEIYEDHKKLFPKILFQLKMEKEIGFVYIDKTHMKQVLDNLIKNAIKFTHLNRGQIIIDIKKQSDVIEISVEDNGEGVKDIDVSKIFDKYSTGASPSIGLGMGLYLCKTIVELHGGSIKAEVSKKLGGAKFIINIPST